MFTFAFRDPGAIADSSWVNRDKWNIVYQVATQRKVGSRFPIMCVIGILISVFMITQVHGTYPPYWYERKFYAYVV